MEVYSLQELSAEGPEMHDSIALAKFVGIDHHSGVALEVGFELVLEVEFGSALGSDLESESEAVVGEQD